MTTVHDSILILLKDAPDVKECIAWANKREALLREYPSEESLKQAQWIVEKWEKVRVMRKKWGGITINTLSADDCITIGELHRHLSSILELYPDTASIPVHHEECCGVVETCRVKFKVDEGILALY
jgi:hypothetical protein